MWCELMWVCIKTGCLGYQHTLALRLHGAMGKGQSPSTLFSPFDRILNKNLRKQGVVTQLAAVQSSLTTGTLTGTSTKAPDKEHTRDSQVVALGLALGSRLKVGRYFEFLYLM